MPRTARLDGLDELLDRQLSAVSRGQLLALGMKDNAMQYRVRRGGPWQTLLPGVYLAASGMPSLAQKEIAALLYAGPGSLITGPMALMHYSIRNGSAYDEVIDVLVPLDRQRLSTGFARLHRTVRMPARVCLSGPVRLALSPEDWDRTRRRHQLMAAAGIIPLHFSPREIRREPAMVTQRIRDALTSGLDRPPLPIRTIPGSVSSQ